MSKKCIPFLFLYLFLHRYSFEEDPAKFTWSTLQNDTFTNEEMGAFKRPKKRRLVKKKKASFEEIEAALQDSTAATDPTPTTTTTTQRDPTLEDEDVTEALAQLARIASHEAKQVSERTNREAEMAAIVAEKEEKVELAEGEVTLKQLSNFANKVRAAQDEVGAKEEEEGEKKKKAVVEAVIDDSRKERLRNVLQDETTTRSLGGTLDIIAKQGLLQDNYAGRAGDTTIDNDDDGEIIRRTNKYVLLSFEEKKTGFYFCVTYHIWWLKGGAIVVLFSAILVLDIWVFLVRLEGGAILCYFLLFWGRRPHQ